MHSIARALPGRRAVTLLFFVACVAPRLPAQSSALRGTVVDSATNAALQGVRIQATGPHTSAVTFTDERGYFRIAVQDSGAVTLSLTRIGYAPRLVSQPSATRLDVAMVARGLPLDPVIVTASRQGTLAFAAPAAVSVVDREQLDGRAALSPIEHVRTTPGMDLASKGLIQHAYAVRGERGSVSGALLTLTDFRYAELPSLALNIPYLIPVSDEDLERIEVVRGPGAALYGPGADRGVLHFITRSPFESPGATVSLAAGERSLVEARGRWAGLLGRRAAVRFSASYLRGTDWPYSDSEENANRAAAIAAGADPDTLRIGLRHPDAERAAGEMRLDWRPNTHTEVITTAGIANAIHAVDLGGDVGSVQGQQWKYHFFQLRLRERRLHVNLFCDASNTGDSYLLRTGATLVDYSRVAAAQVQHGLGLGRFDVLYGADLRWTDPRTDGTINGANEQHDQMTEAGAYLHATTALGARTDLVAALRVDHHNGLNDVVLSPRLGMVFRPSTAHALRVTVNRGFSSPDANSLFLDIVQDSIPGLPYAVRASSVPRNGYTFRRDCGGCACIRRSVRRAPCRSTRPACGPECSRAYPRRPPARSRPTWPHWIPERRSRLPTSPTSRRCGAPSRPLSRSAGGPSSAGASGFRWTCTPIACRMCAARATWRHRARSWIRPRWPPTCGTTVACRRARPTPPRPRQRSYRWARSRHRRRRTPPTCWCCRGRAASTRCGAWISASTCRSHSSSPRGAACPG